MKHIARQLLMYEFHFCPFSISTKVNSMCWSQSQFVQLGVSINFSSHGGFVNRSTVPTQHPHDKAATTRDDRSPELNTLWRQWSMMKRNNNGDWQMVVLKEEHELLHSHQWFRILGKMGRDTMTMVSSSHHKMYNSGTLRKQGHRDDENAALYCEKVCALYRLRLVHHDRVK